MTSMRAENSLGKQYTGIEVISYLLDLRGRQAF